VAQGAFLKCVSALAVSVGRVEVQAHGIQMAAIKIDETRADREFEAEMAAALQRKPALTASFGSIV
jgi:hypothetical protein